MIATAAAIALSLCPPPPEKRVSCVVDGDTAWIAGEKMRLENIDAPELSRPRCLYEKALAIKARDRLLALLNAGERRITRNGVDRYGRALVRITVNGRDVGQQLVREDLARTWTGRREPWC